MFKKVNNFIFMALFLGVLFIPFLFTRWESGGISETENRNLASFPAFMVEEKFNQSFTKEFDTWFMDHMGFRQELIAVNTSLMQNIFHRSLSTSDWKTGRTGDSIYASLEIVMDFAHANLRTEKAVRKIGESYQIVSDWLENQGIPFYYVQCVDKHTIYPERFLASVNQIGNTSKTDQILDYLQKETSVNAIYFKQILEDNKSRYDVFSHWGDPTHWTDRGAYISYCYMMNQIRDISTIPLTVLSEEDYDIHYEINEGPENKSEQIEVFTIKDPHAQPGDVSVMGQWSTDRRHSVWTNPNADNDLRLLLMGDSYFNGYLLDDIAESFREVWLVWGDHTDSLPEIVDLCKPDIVIYECAERVDRSGSIQDLAEALQKAS